MNEPRDLEGNESAATHAVRVWDLPTRLFHWLLALAVVGLVVTAKVGGDAMTIHFRLGLFVLGLLLFRLMWGLVGGRWSRFASFLHTPATILRYLRRASHAGEHHEVGHNPLGSLSVFAMLAILVVQVSTGLIADDEIANTGPLNKYVATATGLAATTWHKTWGQWTVITLVLLHVAAILGYLLLTKTNLVRPMLSGDKLLPASVPAARDDSASRGLALVLAVVAGGVVAWVLRLAA